MLLRQKIVFIVLALLMVGASPTHAQEASNPYNTNRSSSFEYKSTGLLTAEIIEPDNAQLCVRTEYTYALDTGKLQSIQAGTVGPYVDPKYTYVSSPACRWLNVT